MTYDDIEGRRGRCRDRHHRRSCSGRAAFRRMRETARRRGRLTRDADEGFLFGVCAGIARHLGLRPRTVRIATLVLLVFFTAPTVIAYALIAWLAPSARAERGSSTDEALADDGDGEAGGEGSAVDGLTRLKTRFRRLEEKFADVEAQMMSGEGR